MTENELLHTAIHTAVKAGHATMDVYSKQFDVYFKSDHTPITDADKVSNEIINKSLIKTDLPILSEEGKEIPFSKRKKWNHFWLVDPLDGTKEFVKRNGEFTINIALIENKTPIIGVIYAPVQDVLYFASKRNGAYKISNYKKIAGNSLSFEELLMQAKKLVNTNSSTQHISVVYSRSHMNDATSAYIDNHIKPYIKYIDTVSIGSSLKFCILAEGKAQLYPRLGQTMEWDTAAGHAIVKYTGGSVMLYPENTELVYNKETLANPYFIAKMKDALLF